jgi:hypothetical protein
MSQAPLKTKKHLDFTALRHAFSKHLVDIEDHRCEPRCTHTLHDAFMSGFACMFLTNGSGKVTYKNSWVTSIEINDSNVIRLAKGGRCHWKIENECFNTLKNQGYNLKHNFGHGKQHLCHTMYLLTMLAFYFHQIFELSDPAYQLYRRSLVSKRHLWETFGVLIRYFIFETWNDVMLKLMSGRGGIPFLSKEP